MIVRWWQRLLVVATSASLAALRAQDLYQLNGWYACSLDIGADSSAASDVSAECATTTMPLCHGDVCMDEQGRTVDIFVKRIAASSSTSTRNLWVIPDHPSAMSVEDAERQMILLYQELRGDVSVYLMDRRGTGRGTLFGCEASQATSSVSPGGVIVAAREAAGCVNALRTSFGDNFAAAFSLTSAARDVVTFVSQFQANTKVFLYGVGYGTQLVERALHFPSNEIVGFVMDSVATTSGGKLIEFPFKSQSDQAFSAVAKEFTALCDGDALCRDKFEGEDLDDVLRKVYEGLDDGDLCDSVAALLESVSRENSEKPSYQLRRLLAVMLQDAALRSFIPALTYRLDRCRSNGDEVLTTFISELQQNVTSDERTLLDSTGAGAALLVFDLVQFSELWESPSPSASELEDRFSSALIGDGVAFQQLERYCAFTLDTSNACSDFNYAKAAAADSKPLSYARDIHWNTAATIPSQASVLLLQSRYDGETPVDSASVLFDALQGTNKALLIFDAAVHNVLASSPGAVEERSIEAAPSCARSILASYISSDADLRSYDISCLAALPQPLSLNVSEAMSLQVFGVADPFDGVLEASGSSSSGGDGSSTITLPPVNGTDRSLEESRNRYRVAFILLLVLSLVLLAIVFALVYRAYKRRLLLDEEIQLRRLQGAEDDDFEFLRDLYNPSPTEWFNFRSNRVHL